IQLQHIGDGVEIQVVLCQVFVKVFLRFEIGIETLFLGVSHEDDPIGAFQNELAASFVKDLARNGIEMKAGLEAADRAEVQGQKVKEEGASGLRGQRDNSSFLARPRVGVDALQIRVLTPSTRTV